MKIKYLKTKTKKKKRMKKFKKNKWMITTNLKMTFKRIMFNSNKFRKIKCRIKSKKKNKKKKRNVKAMRIWLSIKRKCR